MKNIFHIIFISIIFHSAIRAQVVQGTIEKSESNVVTIFAKPSTDIIDAVFTNIIVTISIPDQTPNPNPILKIHVDHMPSLDWTLLTPFISNGRIYYVLNGTDNNITTPISWLSSMMNPILEIQFAEGLSSAEEIIQLNDLTGENGGTNNFGYWYVEQLGVGDITSYTDKFFLSTGSQNYIIGGDSVNSSIETVELVVLPITLSNFTVQLQGKNNVLLQWVTSSEINSSHFEVERSKDGKYFHRIGEVAAVGNSYLENHYSYLDRDIRLLRNEINIRYYRLRKVDLDGSFTYSQVRAIQLKGQDNGQVHLFPNPTHDLLHIDLPGYIDEGTIYFDLTDMKGIRVASGQWDAGVQSTQLLYLKNLGVGAGVFFLRLTNGKKVLSSHKIVLISY